MRQEISAVEYFSEERCMGISDLSDGNYHCNKSSNDNNNQNHNHPYIYKKLISDDATNYGTL